MLKPEKEAGNKFLGGCKAAGAVEPMRPMRLEPHLVSKDEAQPHLISK